MIKDAAKTAGQERITKRLIVSLLAGAFIYYSLKVHRDWVWSYFDSMMTMPHATPELAQVATASISAITTAFITSSTAVGFIVAFFITGNVAAITSMFKWSSAAQVVGSTVQESVAEFVSEKREEKIETVNTQIVKEMSERYKDDPSYRPLETVPDL